MSNQKEALVAKIGVNTGPMVEWCFEWRQRFFVREEQLLVNLLEDLEGHVWSNGEDRWVWRMEDEGKFTVKSMYAKLEGRWIVENNWSVEELRVFLQLWKSPAPSKVVALSWKVLLDRIPSRLNLRRRNALPPEVSVRCALCEVEMETSIHLFAHCMVARGIWLELLKWVDNMFLMPQNVFNHWLCWNAGTSNKKLIKGFRLIWHAAIWVIWKMRNDKIFNDKEKEVMELVEEIKVLSWRWCLTRLKILSCLYYEWCWNPNMCLIR